MQMHLLISRLVAEVVDVKVLERKSQGVMAETSMAKMILIIYEKLFILIIRLSIILGKFNKIYFVRLGAKIKSKKVAGSVKTINKIERMTITIIIKKIVLVAVASNGLITEDVMLLIVVEKLAKIEITEEAAGVPTTSLETGI